MLWDFLNIFTSVRAKQHFDADDAIDKLNRSYTVIFLVIASLLISAHNIIGPSIICRDEAIKTMPIPGDYINHVCWAKNTYHLEDTRDPSSRTDITYYQWLQFILITLAFLYYLPYLVWKFLLNQHNHNAQLPIDIPSVISTLKCVKIHKSKEYNAAIASTVEYLNNCFVHNSREYRRAIANGTMDYDFETGIINYIKLNNSKDDTRESKRSCLCSCLTFFSSRSMYFKYIFVKCLYVGISLSMFWFLNVFLQFEDGFSLFGVTVLKNLIEHRNGNMDRLWRSKYFPRIVYCRLDFKSEWLHEQDHQFQCSLPANVFNEKIFMFLWFWFALVAFLNVCSLFKWLYLSCSSRKSITNYISFNVSSSQDNQKKHLDNYRLLKSFHRNYLQFDGYFALMLIKNNVDDLCVRRLIETLWKSYSIANLDDEDLMTPLSAYTAKVPNTSTTLNGATNSSPFIRYKKLTNDSDPIKQAQSQPQQSTKTYIQFQKEDLV